MTSLDLAVEDVIDALDSFYCHNHVVALWADAVANRLEGLAIYLLSDELPEVADHARAAARRRPARRRDPPAGRRRGCPSPAASLTVVGSSARSPETCC